MNVVAKGLAELVDAVDDMQIFWFASFGGESAELCFLGLLLVDEADFLNGFVHAAIVLDSISP